MNNEDLLKAQRLLDFTEEDDDLESQTHSQENIIPPVGVAHPELLESFIENIDDEEKILRDIKDIENYHRESLPETFDREVKSYGLRALEGIGGSVGGLLNALSGEALFDDKGDLVDAPMLPSSHELREITKKNTGKKFEPKTKFAKNAHEVVSDVGANASLPGLSFVQKLLVPVVGQTAKAISKAQGYSDTAAEGVKQSIMMISTIANLGNAPKVARNAYSEAIKAVPEGTRMATNKVTKAINDLKNSSWYRTGKTTAKSPAFDEIKRIEDSIQHGSMDVHDALQIRRDINEARNKLGAFNYEPGIDKAAARRYLNDVDEALMEGINQYGASNPTWLKKYNQANEAFNVTKRSQKLNEYIQKNATANHLRSDTAKTLFNLAGASAIAHAPSLILGAAPVVAGAKGMQIINRMIRSPVLRNHYLDVIKNASIQNLGAMNRALQKFDKEASKFENQ